ncbi:unnamed protein product [Linum tenue]|uniref:Uncharacterized protein n=1 Tax=Linum tenue TaxID=586396 RepID=A0AAV0I8Q7_9ROSI|nr:unnamed protein product [Linum tenue]CAI0395795.1 unnamed protein product [Linum tenue]
MHPDCPNPIHGSRCCPRSFQRLLLLLPRAPTPSPLLHLHQW